MPQQSAAVTITITIASPLVAPASIAAPGGTIGQPYSFQLPQPTGGVPPYVWSGASLPAGWTISPSGLLAGTPATAGTLSLSLSVSDSGT